MRKNIVIKYPEKNTVSFTDSVLKNRNVSYSEIMRNFSSIEPPQNMMDAEKAANRIVAAIQGNQSIVLYTDYDADGFGCAVVFTELMRNIPYDNFFVFYNDREMGFGMKKNGIDLILQKNPDVKLIVTSDNGIVAFDAVDYANSLGIDVVVTDHHMPDESGRLPNAVAVVNPHRADETCVYKDFCGTGVLYKVMALVYYMLYKDNKHLNDVLDIVALATIADVVPLTGENRIFSKIGLSKMSQDCREQWSVFKELGSTYKPLLSFTSKDVGFFIGPCINAASRMLGNPSKPLEAFLNTKDIFIHHAITELVEINNVRKTVQRQRSAEAFHLISDCEDDFIVVSMQDCEEGVVGLVAGDVCNETYHPTIVLAPDGHGNLKGSGRSIPGVHIKNLLDDVNRDDPSILISYGGHSQACGLTVRSDKLDRLRTLLNEKCKQLLQDNPNLFVEEVKVDYLLDDVSQLQRLYAEKSVMEPFGCEFPEPIVMLVFKPDSTKLVKDGKHIIFKYKGIDITSWNSGYKLNGKNPQYISRVIAIGTIESGSSINCQHELLQISME